MAVYAASSLWAAALVLSLAHWVEPVRLFYLFNFLTIFHYGPTWLRAYGDREQRVRERWSLYLFPPAVFAFAWLTRDRPEILAFITYFWDRWHAVMQNYGFMRVYDAKAATSTRRRARIDFGLLITASLFLMSLNMGLLAPFMSVLQSIGLSPLTSVAAVHGLQIALGVVTAIAAAIWLRGLSRVRARQLPRVIFLGCLVAGHAVMNLTTNIFLLASHEKIYHSLQYVALTWSYGHHRAARAPVAETGPELPAIFGPRRWPVYAGLALAWTVLAVLANRAATNYAASGLFTTLIGGFALCHYYFDSFLWRVRRPEVRANL